MSRWIGLNYPWHHYGHDFGVAWGHSGVSVSQERIAADFERMRTAGARVIRWFVFADGRAAPAASSLGPHVLDDLRAALGLLDEADLDVIFVLFDYLMCAPAHFHEGVQIGGRSDWVRTPATTIDRAVEFVRALEDHPRVRAIELMNEPVWALRGPRSLVEDPVTHVQMLAFLSSLASALRAETRAPLTLGAASADDLDTLWGALPLDLPQFHHYSDSPLPARAGFALVGEVGSARESLAAHVAEARARGWGCLPWALRSEDDETDAARALAALSGSG